jgi:hypothetical protein
MATLDASGGTSYITTDDITGQITTVYTITSGLTTTTTTTITDASENTLSVVCVETVSDAKGNTTTTTTTTDASGNVITETSYVAAYGYLFDTSNNISDTTGAIIYASGDYYVNTSGVVYATSGYTLDSSNVLTNVSSGKQYNNLNEFVINCQDETTETECYITTNYYVVDTFGNYMNSAGETLVSYNNITNPDDATDETLYVLSNLVVDLTTAEISTTTIATAEATTAAQTYQTNIVSAINSCYSSKMPSNMLTMAGLVGKYTRHFYNNLCAAISDVRLLQFGVWRGASFFSAAYKNSGTYYGYDNWSEYDFANPREDYFMYYGKYIENDGVSKTVKLIEEDCYNSATLSILPSFNIVIYDVEQDECCRTSILNTYYSKFDDTFIYVVDDWNWDFIRIQTIEAIRNNNLTVVYQIEKYTDSCCGNKDMCWSGLESWMNGVCIFVLSKST